MQRSWSVSTVRLGRVKATAKLPGVGLDINAAGMTHNHVAAHIEAEPSSERAPALDVGEGLEKLKHPFL